MLHVICLNAGDYLDRGAEYVNVLFDSVRRNLPEGFAGDFTVFTDDPSGAYFPGIIVRPLPAPWLSGWWGKIGLFDPDLFHRGERILYLDLDTAITGPLDDIAAYSGNFAILRDFYRPTGLQSSVMAWPAGANKHIWQAYQDAGCPQDWPGGDQQFIELHTKRCDLWQNLLKGQFVSYKVSAKDGIPKDARVCVFHGEPRPHEVEDGWVPHVWKIGGGTSAEFVYVTNVPRETIVSNIQAAMKRSASWLQMAEPHDGEVLICAGGPSLADEIPSLRAHQAGGASICAVNGSYRFLWDNLLVPSAHVICDAREANHGFVPDSAHSCERLYASQCDPKVLDAAGDNLTLWHPYFDGILEITGDPPATAYVGGGTTAGLKAVAIYYARGYRKIHLFGFDSSYRGKENHAYSQPLNDGERIVDVEIDGSLKFQCAPWMVTQAEDFQNLAQELTAAGCQLFIHGDGLIPAMAAAATPSLLAAEVRATEILSRLEGVSKPVVAEIGVFAADLSKRLLARRHDLKLFMIDSWTSDHSAAFIASDDFHAKLAAEEQDGYFELAKAMTSFAQDRAVVIRRPSADAAAEIEDNSLDLAFIDADHSYEGCQADIAAYWPKVKPGGYLAGHDYANDEFKFGPMVKRAVDEFAAARGLALDLGQNYTWFAAKPARSAA